MNKQNKQLIQDLYYKQLRESYPSFPEFALPPYKPCETTANGLTSLICNYLNWSNHQAERISSMGRSIDTSKQVTDVIGRTRTIGGTKYIPGNSTKGTADISATINGRSVKIEVKINKDRMSEAQKKYKENIERAGGVYIIARDFDTFLTELNNIMKTGTKLHNGIEIPINAVVKTNNEGLDVRISSISVDTITFCRIKDNTFYEIPFNQKILDLFNN